MLERRYVSEEKALLSSPLTGVAQVRDRNLQIG